MKTFPRNVNLAAFLATAPVVVQPVQGVGDAFHNPFKASVRVRQLCYEESIYGCSPDDIPGMNGEGGRRRHLLETDPDGQMFLTYEEEVIETGPASQSSTGGGPSNIQAAPLDATDFWIFEDVVTEDGVNYNRYVARFDNITRDFSDDASEQHKMLIESGMVPDVYEYLEATEGGTPHAIRLFSSRNDNLMYSETKFASVEELTEDELVLSVARADSGGLRRKLQQKTKSAKIATRPRPRHTAAKGNLRRRTTAVVSGLIVPPNCLTNPDSFFCFALLSSQNAETGDKTIALNIALQSLLTDDSANIFGRLVLGPDGQLLYLEGSAEGCASPVGFRVGSLAAVGVEICVDGNVEFVPGLSLDASFGISAGIFFDVFGFINAKLDLLGGQVGVSAAASPNDGVLRFESFNGNVYSRLQFLVVYVEAGVSIESSPRDVLEVDNWVTNIFFTPAVGIDLWLWKASARTSFKIAQVGPERVQQSVNPPIELPPDLNTPLCPSSTVEASRNGDLLVIVNLPGGRKEGSVLTIDNGVRALDKDGVCYRVAWESLEFTCTDNNSQHEWIQTNGQFTIPGTNDVDCRDVGLDNEYVQAVDSAPTICSAKSFERRNGPIWVSFLLPGDQVSGSTIDFEAGFAYRSVDQTCYSLSWGEHSFQCGDDGEWIETAGSWPLIRHQCSNGEGFISNGDQTFLEVSNTMATSCSATTFEWSNHPIYVKISLPEGNGAIDFDYGSAARRLSDDSCPSLEWVALTFTCDRTTVEWTMTKGYFRNRVPLYCYMWETGYGYISGGEQEYMQVVDTTVLPGCPATESAYSCGPLWVTFSPPDSYLRGDTLSFDGGAMARGDCHGLSWSAHEFYCDPFRGVWLNKEGTLLTCNGHTEPPEGCTDGELAITNGNQSYLKVADATPEIVPTPAPNTPSPTVTTYCHCPRCDQSVWDTDAGGYTCGARIIYLNRVRGLTLQNACRQVAGAEFPWECGQCDPNYCR